MVDLMVRSENIGYHEENWNERIYDASMGGKGELDNMLATFEKYISTRFELN